MPTQTFDEDKAELEAIHELFRRSTIPILAKIGEQFAVIGTGTLFEIAKRFFLIV